MKLKQGTPVFYGSENKIGYVGHFGELIGDEGRAVAGNCDGTRPLATEDYINEVMMLGGWRRMLPLRTEFIRFTNHHAVEIKLFNLRYRPFLSDKKPLGNYYNRQTILLMEDALNHCEKLNLLNGLNRENPYTTGVDPYEPDGQPSRGAKIKP